MRKVFALFVLLLFAVTGSVHALVEDINANDVITVNTVATKGTFKANTWYTIYNQGRKAYAYGDATVTSQAPMSGYSVNDGHKFLIRFVSSGTEGKYYIQTAAGSYYKDLANNSSTGITTDKASAGLFTIGEISSGNWYLKGTNFVMDSNGAAILGYGTTIPTTAGGNNAWTMYEVSTCDPSQLSGGALVSYQLLKGDLFRIQSRGNSTQYICENTATHKATTQAKTSLSSTRMRQMWVIEHDDNGFSLRNADSGEYLQDNYTCTSSKYYWNVRLSPNNTSASDPYIIFAHGEIKSGTNNCINLNGGSSGLTNYRYDNDKNSEWIIVPVTEVSTEAVKAKFDQVSKSDKIDLEAGVYYQFINLNNGGMLTERLSDGMVIALEASEKSWNQYWKLAQNEEGMYSLQNVYSGKYINRKAVNASSACGGNYMTTSTVSNNRFWSIEEGSYPWQTTINFIEPIKPTTGISINTSSLSYNNDINATDAQWVVKRVELTEEEIQQAQDEYSDNKILLNTSTTVLNGRIQKFFTDYACTTLRDEYKEMSDEEITALMDNESAPLPSRMKRMVLKIKNDTWGHREKEFRIYDYAPYSDPTKWNSGSLVGTSYQFSPQTGPTGISVKAGDIIIFYVNANPAAYTTLEYSSVPGCNVTATRTSLKRGVNIFTPNADGFIYIHHTITNTSKKLADFSPITIHIEGGRVQGYFDITRGHTNADWKDMKATLFQDEIVHLKSKYYQYNMHYDQLLKEIKPGELDEVDTDGCPKGIEGTLRRWDDLVAVQRYVMGADQFNDRFNCMLSASSSSNGNPYASSYGTYYPGVGTIMNYDALTHGKEYDHGGNFWCIAHETGHVHQNLYNMAGCTEVSNNNFSQINTWIQGSNTGRGGPWSEAQSSFHQKVFWFEYDLWQRSRAYFQLWLYFHLQEHDTTFYPRLFDKFRETPMSRSGNKNNPGSGTTDYLRFAKFACDVAQADLSEFFQFWGFFVPLDNYEVGDYSNSYFTTTQAEINEAIAYMHQYKKKLGNILFIDERIEKYPADYPGMPEGAMRVATTPGATPGVASQVGETGMFTMFVDDVDYMQYACTVSTTTGKVIVSQASGKGAVGFKVYDADHNLVNCYNTHNFTLPSSVYSKPFYILAALGDGTDRLLYDPNDISAVINNATAENGYDATAPVYSLDGQPVAMPQSGKIYIQNGVKFRMK